jgi:methionyl-tRNA formyltransferase
MNILVLTNSVPSKFIDNLRANKSINLYISYQFEDIEKSIDVVFTYNYDKIIPVGFFDLPKIGIFVLHSSDLPQGRGWAPIYNSIVNKEDKYVISLIRISEKPDCGNIFLKLYFDKPKLITNNNLRSIDETGLEIIVNKFIELCIDKRVTHDTIGLEQSNTRATNFKRRTPEDNIIDKDKTISNAIYEILATNEDYPSYVEIDGIKVYLSAQTDIQIKLQDTNHTLEVFI